MMHWLFWFSVVGLAYSTVGYPALVMLLARRFGSLPKGAAPGALPTVSIVIAAYQEAGRIGERIENLFLGDYPREQLEVIVVSDGSTDATAEIVRLKGGRCIERKERRGKAACLNDGVAEARGELLLFCDARQSFDRDAIRMLVSNFSDERVGAASGALLVGSESAASAEGVSAYWSLEKRLREAESRLDSAIGCTGAIYVIRRSLYRELPPDTLLDDVVIPMTVAAQGYRVIFDRRAIARDPQPFSPGAERRRKRRTLAGNFQMLFRHPEWVCPWGHRLWWQLISHKYLRLGFPIYVCGALAASFALWRSPFYGACAVGGVIFFALGVLGMIPPFRSLQALAPLSGFLFLSLSVLDGFVLYLRSSRSGAWETAEAERNRQVRVNR